MRIVTRTGCSRSSTGTSLIAADIGRNQKAAPGALWRSWPRARCRTCIVAVLRRWVMNGKVVMVATSVSSASMVTTLCGHSDFMTSASLLST